MSDDATPAKVRLTDGLGPLPAPEVLHELHDEPCPACHTMLRALPPIKMGYTAAQMEAYAMQAIAVERERCARIVETQDTYGDSVGCWFETLAAKIRA